jgi:hypothetical protein
MERLCLGNQVGYEAVERLLEIARNQTCGQTRCELSLGMSHNADENGR